MLRFIRRIVVLGAVVAFVAGCGGGSGGGSAGKCTASSVAAGLNAQGTVCADTGLRPASGGFSFENWAGPVAEDAVTVTTAISIFGEKAVCARSADGSCTPYPAVNHWIAASNEQIQGGRCEGMAVLSQRLNDGENTPSQLQKSAASAFDLSKPTLPVAETISRWWVSQGFENVLQATNKAAQMDPSKIVGKLVDAISAKAGATIGIYSHGGGHAITPIAITENEDGTFSILTYDNNFPGKVTSLAVDPRTETWTYDVGATSAGSGSTVWSGGKGSMDYALMADREGEQKVPWSNDDRAAVSKGSARITVSTGGASFAGLLIKVGDKTIDTRDLSTVTAGVKVYPNRGGNIHSVGTGAMVEIPAGLKHVKITPVVGELVHPGDAVGELLVEIDAPGPESELITDPLAAGDLDGGDYHDFELDLSTDSGFDSTVDVAPDGSVDVGVAFEEEAMDVTLEDGENLEAHEPVGGEDLSFDVTSENGQQMYDSSFDGVDEDGSLGTAMVDINEESGEVVVADEPLKAETVDDDLLAIAEADAASAAARAADDSVPDSVVTEVAPSQSDQPNSSSTPNETKTTTATTTDDSSDEPSTTESNSGSDASDGVDHAPETTHAGSHPSTEPPETTEALQQGDAGSDG